MVDDKAPEISETNTVWILCTLSRSRGPVIPVNEKEVKCLASTICVMTYLHLNHAPSIATDD